MNTLTLSLVASLLIGIEPQGADWMIDSADDWTRSIKSVQGASLVDGTVSPDEKTAMVVTKLYASDVKRSVRSLTVTQSPLWQNWNPIENLGPVNLGDAPVLLTVGPDNYWMFGRYGNGQPRRRKDQKRKHLANIRNRLSFTKLNIRSA